MSNPRLPLGGHLSKHYRAYFPLLHESKSARASLGISSFPFWGNFLSCQHHSKTWPPLGRDVPPEKVLHPHPSPERGAKSVYLFVFLLCSALSAILILQEFVILEELFSVGDVLLGVCLGR
ncbi:hypothetical protein CEXT_161361 [Caerostris extrusa]|uniref:Uncharacterized protein n=1 Tax=Caerostris extrusa TaxID=172846 RepID=A0AAV4NXY3_CAEEX|nr:hypothetical protein CEXT_161361 [Caerostris extrusa]